MVIGINRRILHSGCKYFWGPGHSPERASLGPPKAPEKNIPRIRRQGAEASVKGLYSGREGWFERESQRDETERDRDRDRARNRDRDRDRDREKDRGKDRDRYRHTNR